MNTQQLNLLKKALLFLKMAELRDVCARLYLPTQGTKNVLIAWILHFIKTGEIIKEPKIPDASKAKRGNNYSLSPETLILKGAYKNDLKTRLFFKTLIGEYFHFTAFGIDWLNARWLEGKPPTYQEFAQMWKSEYARREKEGTTPKEEWAYIGAEAVPERLGHKKQNAGTFAANTWLREFLKKQQSI